MSEKKPYSDKRWQGGSNEFKEMGNFVPTPEEKKKHDDFMKSFRKEWNLDENGKIIKDK
ncbi:hypothetical protein [Bombilactobacillus bombi]|uniref:hypothetical protein n=1 Tax=Bombilactobacillus bombi TaxID=1303590 RepID=UPI0015FDC21A|nr:hypothetical protein [Bombilactobacillus bombi]